MPSKIRRIDYFPDEMIAGVAGRLQAVDFGIYWMICTLIYSRGGPIDNDHIWMARLFHKTHWRVVRASMDRLIAFGKVVKVGNQLTVVRCENELQRARKRVAGAPQDRHKRAASEPQETPVSNENNDISKTPTNNYQPATIRKKGAAKAAPKESADDLNRPAFLDRTKGTNHASKRLPSGIDPDWQLDAGDRQYAREQGSTEDEIEAMLASFVAHHTNGPGRTRRWKKYHGANGAWGTWVRNEAKFRSRGPSAAGNRQAGPGGRGDTGVVAALRTLKDRRETL